MTSYFEIQGCPKTEKKKIKYLHGSGETVKETKDWKKIEGKWRDMFKFTRTKTERLVLTD